MSTVWSSNPTRSPPRDTSRVQEPSRIENCVVSIKPVLTQYGPFCGSHASPTASLSQSFHPGL